MTLPEGQGESGGSRVTLPEGEGGSGGSKVTRLTRLTQLCFPRFFIMRVKRVKGDPPRGSGRVRRVKSLTLSEGQEGQM